MSRAFVIVIDSVGIGGAPDADRFFNGPVPDTGANTLGHIARACRMGRAEEGRSGPLHLPVMAGLGLGRAMALSDGADLGGADMGGPDLGGAEAPLVGAWGAATEKSPGKDTPSGHWELAGVPVPWNWHYFPDTVPAFPDDLIAEVCQIAHCEGVLGNRHASGTEIIAEEGARHIETGWPICYTSADSVFQIAAHEGHFGLDRLLALCEAIAPRLHTMKVGRVIARPFVGDPETGFTRTANRHDYAIAPPAPTLCDWVSDAGRPVHAVGKIGDIFSMRGITDVRKGPDRDLMAALGDLAATAGDGALVFANLVEFDSLYGHRRDVCGYARHLEWFDRALGALLGGMGDGDLVVVTADHGNDPTWTGTDHTRERVPVLVHGAGARQIGHVAFTDVAASVATHLGVAPRGPGRSFL